jgi:DNA-directed RNA polymerase delta subunit
MTEETKKKEVDYKKEVNVLKRALIEDRKKNTQLQETINEIKDKTAKSSEEIAKTVVGRSP